MNSGFHINETGRKAWKTGLTHRSGRHLIVWLVFWVPWAKAEVLYEKEGIQLRGTARIISYNAAICHVSEANYTAERYQELKANEGQPLHVWQLDFSVYNGSGKSLSFLRADFDIESESPPCTNWKGGGPGGGPSGGPYSDTVFWGNQSRTLSATAGMTPAAAKQGVLFLAVFHTDRPSFERWSTNFTYGEPEGGGHQPESPSGIAAPASGSPLPVEVMLDEYLMEAEILSEAKDHKGALEAMNRVVALQKEHGLTLPEEFPFKYAQAALAAGSFEAASDAATQYLAKAGRGGKHYREALALRVKSRRGLQAPAVADSVPRAAFGADIRGNQRIQPRARERLAFEPEMVEIPGGSFRMGCISGQGCYDDEHPIRTVRIERFEMSKYEVTFEEYDRFTSATGRARVVDRRGRGRRPVINVSWEDAVAYARWLSEQTGERYRLPTEAEWEYAARAGTETAYSWGNTIGRNRANCDGCGSRWDNSQTAPVGSFGANRWGLHDMHGNVWEWVQDCWNDSYRGAPTDGSAWQQGECSQRVLRGGSWGDPGNLRSANRFRRSTTFRLSDLGFRVARTVTP